MDKTNKDMLTVFAVIGTLAIFIGYGWLIHWGDVTDHYDWAHGYNAHTKTTFAHCEDWVDKYVSKDPTNPKYYKHQCECLYKNGDCDDMTYKEFKVWYKKHYKNGHSKMNYDDGTGFLGLGK